MRKFLLPLLLLSACDRSERPQAPTAAESERLDEAEDMLNGLAENQEEAAPVDAAPSGNLN